MNKKPMIELNGYNLVHMMRKARRQHRISAQSQATFHELIAICNEENWKKSFKCSNGELCANLNVSEKSLILYRSELIEAGLIDYISGKSKKEVGVYSFNTSNYCKISSQPDSQSYSPKGSQSASLSGSLGVEKTPDLIKHKTKTKIKSIDIANAISRNDVVTNDYETLVESLAGQDILTVKRALREFILTRNPRIADPYVEAWNLFASDHKLPKMTTLEASRRKKIEARLKESEFDFFKILDCIRQNSFYTGDNDRAWKVDLDHITKSQLNYIKIIEKHNDSGQSGQVNRQRATEIEKSEKNLRILSSVHD